MKHLLTFCVTLLCVNVLCQVPTNGLVSSYPFTGNSNDASGNNNNLTPFNGPTLTTDRFGNQNCAYFFDGINDYFTAPNPGPLLKKSRTLAFWAKTAVNFNSQGYTVLHYGDPTTGGARFEVGLNSGCNSLYLDLGYGYGSKTFNTIDNMWHFYAIVFDSTQMSGYANASYYVDANLISSFCYSYNPSQVINTQMADPINIGRFTTSLPRYFSGSLDDIRVFNRPLSLSEITALFNENPVGITSNELANMQVSVSPNPCTTELKIEGLKTDLTAQITNSLGKIILNTHIKSNNPVLSVKELPTGIYFVRLQEGNTVVIKKFVKE